MNEVFSIQVHNRQFLEQGKQGVWLDLPTTTETLQAALRDVGITADNPQDFFINGYSCPEDRHLAIPYDMVLAADVDELNFLAARLGQLDAAEIAELNAALQNPRGGFENIGQIIDYTENVDYHTLKGGKEQGYNPKLTAARVALAKTESEIEKLLDTLSGANPLLLQYANNRIEELDTERQKQLKLVADLTANSVSDTQIDCITNYLNDWESVSFDDKRKVVDILISHIDATSESVTIHWKI